MPEFTRAEYDDMVFPEIYAKIRKLQEQKEKDIIMGKFNSNNVTVSSYLPVGLGNVRVLLSDGTKVEGSPDKVARVLSGFNISLDANNFYLSSTKGLVRIKDMATNHIKNAIVKKYIAWLESLKTASAKEFYQAVMDGPSELAGLVAELSKRND